MELKTFNVILFLMVGLCKLLRCLEILVSFSSTAISHFPERLTDVGTMQICHVLYLGETTTLTIDRISLSPTRDVTCAQNGPHSSFTFCEHPNVTTWSSFLGCTLCNLLIG